MIGDVCCAARSKRWRVHAASSVGFGGFLTASGVLPSLRRAFLLGLLLAWCTIFVLHGPGYFCFLIARFLLSAA